MNIHLIGEMRLTALFFLLILSLPGVRAQEMTLGKIRGIVVGVSKYKNLSKDYQLNYADADAEVFYDFLRAMPNADPDNIFLLTNEDASMTSFKARFGEAYKNSQPGDMLLVYFAGHGNLQRGNQEGFLLFHGINQNDTEYFIDEEALPLSYLHSCERQCMSKTINFVVITDACHSGKIMSETGAKNTMALLNAQWDYSLKLTSSQVTQVSYEDSVLRHGYFTYYLIESIRAATDEMGLYEGIVEPIEFETSLKSSVTKRANEIKGRQTPAIMGNPNFALFKQQPQLVTARLDDKAGGGKRRDLAESQQPGIIQSFYESLEARRLVSAEELSDLKISADKSTTVRISNNPIQALAATHDGETLAASASKETRIHLYKKELEAWKPYREIQVGSAIQNLIFSPDSKFLIVSLTSGALEIWDWVSNTKIKSQSTAGTLSMDFSGSGDRLITGDYAGVIRVFRFPSFELEQEIKAAHTSVINKVAWLGGANLFASVSGDRWVKVWKVGELKPVYELRDHQAAVTGLAVNTQGPVIYTGDETGLIIKWQPTTQTKAEQTKINNKIFDFSLSLDGRVLNVSGWNSAVNVIGTSPLKEIIAVNVSNRGLPKILQSPSGSWMTTGDYGGNVILTKVNRPQIYANHLFERIAANTQFKTIIPSVESDYAAALLHESHSVVQAFIAGRDISPTTTEIKQAIRQLEYLIKITPGDEASHEFISPRLEYLKGVLLMQSADAVQLNKAIETFSQLLKKNPDATYPLVAIAQAHRKKNELEKANTNLQQAATALPKWTEPKSNLGQIQLAEGNFEEARKYFKQIIELEPNSAKGYRWMGEVELKSGNLTKASHDFKRASDIEPNNPYLITQLAHIDRLRGKFKDAGNTLGKAASLDLNYCLPLVGMGENSLQLFKHTHQQEHLTNAYNHALKAIEINNADEQANALAGKIISIAFASLDSSDLQRLFYAWSLNGDLSKASEQALNYFNQSISTAPASAEAYLQKAIFLTRIRQDVNLAAKAIESQRQITGATYDYFLNLCKFWLAQQRLPEAEKNLRSAIGMKPNFPDAYIALIEYLQKKDNLTELQSFQTMLPVTLKGNASLLLPLAAAMAPQKKLESDVKKFLTEIKSLDAENRYVVTLERNLTHTTRNKNQLATEIQIDAAEIKAMGGLPVVAIGNKKFITDNLGFFVIELKYEEVIPLGSSVFLAKQGGKWGIWNQLSSKPITFSYDRIEKNGQFMAVQSGAKWGLINDAGKPVTAIAFKQIKILGDFIYVMGDGGWGVLNMDGKTIVRPSYQSITEGRYKVRKVFIALKGKKNYYFTLDGECLNCAGN